jgi:hypothetical protein
LLLIKARRGKWLLAGLATISLGVLSRRIGENTQNVQDNANVLSAKTERYIDKDKTLDNVDNIFNKS